MEDESSLTLPCDAHGFHIYEGLAVLNCMYLTTFVIEESCYSYMYTLTFASIQVYINHTQTCPQPIVCVECVEC